MIPEIPNDYDQLGALTKKLQTNIKHEITSLKHSLMLIERSREDVTNDLQYNFNLDKIDHYNEQQDMLNAISHLIEIKRVSYDKSYRNFLDKHKAIIS